MDNINDGKKFVKAFFLLYLIGSIFYIVAAVLAIGCYYRLMYLYGIADDVFLSQILDLAGLLFASNKILTIVSFLVLLFSAFKYKQDFKLHVLITLPIVYTLSFLSGALTSSVSEIAYAIFSILLLSNLSKLISINNKLKFMGYLAFVIAIIFGAYEIFSFAPYGYEYAYESDGYNMLVLVIGLILRLLLLPFFIKGYYLAKELRLNSPIIEESA